MQHGWANKLKTFTQETDVHVQFETKGDVVTVVYSCCANNDCVVFF